MPKLDTFFKKCTSRFHLSALGMSRRKETHQYISCLISKETDAKAQPCQEVTQHLIPKP